MKSVLVLGLVSFALSAPALAADLPVKTAPSLITTGAPLSSWTGFYVGANVGYGWGNLNDITFAGISGSGDTNFNGVNGGGQAGYNWQTGVFVLGLEGDIQASGESHTDTTTGSAFGVTFSSSAERKLSSFATIRARVGVVPWDQGLIYFTGGWAWMQGRFNLNATALGTSVSVLDVSSNGSGWTIGAGYEHRLWDHWSAKLEYLYMQSGTISASSTAFGVPFTMSGRFTNSVVRGGINYHF
jgi:outer membrane immunogenic protein